MVEINSRLTQHQGGSQERGGKGTLVHGGARERDYTCPTRATRHSHSRRCGVIARED